MPQEIPGAERHWFEVEIDNTDIQTRIVVIETKLDLLGVSGFLPADKLYDMIEAARGVYSKFNIQKVRIVPAPRTSPWIGMPSDPATAKR